MDSNIFNAVFFSFLITSIIGCLLKCSSMFYKSKCKEVSLCCLRVVRDIEAEEEEHKFDITHQTNLNNSTKINE